MNIIENNTEKHILPEAEKRKNIFNLSNFVATFVLLSFCAETIHLKISNFLAKFERNLSFNPRLSPILNDKLANHPQLRLAHLNRSLKIKNETYSATIVSN